MLFKIKQDFKNFYEQGSMQHQSQTEKLLKVGIDASNIRIGGGITHLVELLTSANPTDFGISNVIVWGNEETLARLPDKNWLQKEIVTSLGKGFLNRLVWQKFSLKSVVKKFQCDILFVPGGNLSCSFRPVVTMSRNLLPFEWQELRRYHYSFIGVRLILLRILQSYSFRRADGLIFLTSYASNAVQKVTKILRNKSVIIPHGYNVRFGNLPKLQQPITSYSEANPYRLLYVSIIDLYKHQWCVVKAIRILRNLGYPVVLELVGPAYKPALNKLKSLLLELDPQGQWVSYKGEVPYQVLDRHYKNADLGIFASSCENMPNILLENMAAGLPIACSSRGPMPEVLGEAGLFFDPENPKDIARVIQTYLESPALRLEKANLSTVLSQQYTWERCANQTMKFIANTAREYSKRSTCAE